MKTDRRFRLPSPSAAFLLFLSVVVAMVLLLPVVWVVSSSFKTLTGIGAYPPQLIPEHPTLANYSAIFVRVNFLGYLINTLILIVGCTGGTLISSAIVAYPLARMNFKGRGLAFSLILATMMVPTTALVIPQYLLFSKFGWLNSFLPMVVPAFFAYPYNVFLFRQFYMTIPKSLDESARIDGCGHWKIFSKVILPLSQPIMVTIGVLSSVFWWNEIFSPLIYIDSNKYKPLVLGALTAFKTEMVSRWDWEMAFSSLMILPPVLLFFFAQKQLMQGIKTTGMKG